MVRAWVSQIVSCNVLSARVPPAAPWAPSRLKYGTQRDGVHTPPLGRACPGDATGFSVRYQGELLGTETFKIVIPVENYPKKPKNRLAEYHPLRGLGGC